jgi:serine/threonine-protein kinase
VYEAHSPTGDVRAVKILRREFCDEAEIVDRFLSEVKASARVDHPGLARVYEAVRAADGTPYLVMELIAGQTLAHRMNRGRVSVEQATGLVISLLQALATAHPLGVVHRDLKPGNIFVVGDPISGTDVKILDFGIALVMDAAGGMQRKTRTGMLLGTPGYMSPEQIRSIKHADHRADLWSVGIIFYELLTGRPAFDAENEFERITKVLSSDPTPIEQVAPQYAHWGPFFARALARIADERFQSAQEMAEALLSVARHGQLNRPSHAPSAQVHPSHPPQASHPPTLGQGMPAYPSQPIPGAVSPSPYGSVPPPPASYVPVADPNAPPPPRFGTSDTAISAGVPSPHLDTGPRVEVVTPKVSAKSLPIALALLLAAVALLIGFSLGFVVGRI